MATKYERLEFDFSTDSVKELDKMVEDSGLSCRAEVIREALELFRKHIAFRNMSRKQVDEGKSN